MSSAAAPTRPLDFPEVPPEAMAERAAVFLQAVRTRRSVRHFRTDPVPLDVVRTCIEAAAQAPSGANQQPWTFVLVTDPAVKRTIRAAAEAEERAFYQGRAPAEWLAALAALGTDEHKPFLEEAPVLIAVFAQVHGPAGEKHYYVKESVGLACGFLLAALHQAGLATLTHTPSPMAFLARILGRPDHEKPFLLIPVGRPAPDCEVPDIKRKDLASVLVEVGPAGGP